jgi:hypothetical protein
MVTAAVAGAVAPAWDAYLYFILHLFVAVLHVVATAMLITAAGVASRFSVGTRVFGIIGHVGQLALHVILGVVAFFNFRLRGMDGEIPWWLMLAVAMIAIGLPFYLWGARRDLTELFPVGR